MKKMTALTLLIGWCILILSVESKGQTDVLPKDTVDYVEFKEKKESEIGENVVGAGWLIVTLGAVMNIAGWGINNLDGGGVVVVGIGFGLFGTGIIVVGAGKSVKKLVKKKRKKEKRRDDFKKHISEMSANLSKLESDVDDSTYFDRIMKLSLDSNFHVIQLSEARYGNEQIKFIGLKSKHNYGRNPDYLYKIGTWRYFYRNGQLKKRVDYDLRERKHGLFQLSQKNGQVIIRDQYRYDKRVY